MDSISLTHAPSVESVEREGMPVLGRQNLKQLCESAEAVAQHVIPAGSSNTSPSFAPEDFLDFLEAKVEKVRSETYGAQKP